MDLYETKIYSRNPFEVYTKLGEILGGESIYLYLYSALGERIGERIGYITDNKMQDIINIKIKMRNKYMLFSFHRITNFSLDKRGNPTRIIKDKRQDLSVLFDGPKIAELTNLAGILNLQERLSMVKINYA